MQVRVLADLRLLTKPDLPTIYKLKFSLKLFSKNPRKGVDFVLLQFVWDPTLFRNNCK